MRSKQALGRAGRCGSHSSEDAHGDRDIMGHHEPWTWPQGDAGSHKRAAGLSTSGDALPQGRMLSTKVGCSVSQMLSTKAGCSASRLDDAEPGGMVLSTQGDVLHPRECSAPMEDAQHGERVLSPEEGCLAPRGDA